MTAIGLMPTAASEASIQKPTDTDIKQWQNELRDHDIYRGWFKYLHPQHRNRVLYTLANDIDADIPPEWFL